MKDIWQLTRPRLVLAVLFAVAVVACSAAERVPPWWRLAHTLVGTALVIIGSIAFNQLIERDGDARMPRTASRPLPARRLSPCQAILWGLVTSAAGIVYLAVFAAPVVVLMAVTSWGIYVCLYTPLKRVTVWHTAIGAIAGAMPLLIGAATAGAALAPVALVLFGVAYLWQWPHTMAIGYIYRDQFRVAGIRVAPAVDPDGRLARGLAVGGASALLGVSLLLPPVGPAGIGFACVAAALGVVYLTLSVRFARCYDIVTARTLLRGSLVYLPALLSGYLLAVRS